VYWGYIARKVLSSILTLFLIVILIFVLARVIPGDPVRNALWDSSEQQIQMFRHELALDRPLLDQFYLFVRGLLLEGKLGLSLRSFQDVSLDLYARLPATLELVIIGVAIAVLIGVPLGVTSANNRNKPVDFLVRAFSVAGVTLPNFMVGIALQLAFAFSLRLLPVFGRYDPYLAPPTHVTGLYLLDSLLTLNPVAFATSLKYILLPAIVLSLAPLAQLTRIVRSSMLEETTKDYVVSARANGLPEILVTYKYMLKRAFSATLTQIGVIVGVLLGGSFVIETVFSWPGISYYGVQAILYKDFNAIVGVTIIVGFAFVLINAIVDSIYLYLDPRTRFQE
jgi:peptide/nickel transport system permease protein